MNEPRFSQSAHYGELLNRLDEWNHRHINERDSETYKLINDLTSMMEIAVDRYEVALDRIDRLRG